ncbi:hypothetical protein [Arthrobacter sp. AET 35A]|nr:hypothetical protein [Arthrobacter sp. AET 35A]
MHTRFLAHDDAPNWVAERLPKLPPSQLATLEPQVPRRTHRTIYPP